MFIWKARKRVKSKKKSPKEKQILIVSLSSSSLLWLLIVHSQDKEHQVFLPLPSWPCVVWSLPQCQPFVSPSSVTIHFYACLLCHFKSTLICYLIVRWVQVQAQRAWLLCSGYHKAESSCWLDWDLVWRLWGKIHFLSSMGWIVSLFSPSPKFRIIECDPILQIRPKPKPSPSECGFSWTWGLYRVKVRS